MFVYVLQGDGQPAKRSVGIQIPFGSCEKGNRILPEDKGLDVTRRLSPFPAPRSLAALSIFRPATLAASRVRILSASLRKMSTRSRSIALAVPKHNGRGRPDADVLYLQGRAYSQ